MLTFKCKMCGGDLEFEQGATVAECPYCGSRQTLPRLDNDRRANMYDRANHFRRQNEYDKAMAIYEQILQEDRSDAEAYWSLVLCRYGIEYVQDPASRRRIPTVNRVQYASILADEDYKNALQYADGVQRGLYEEEAAAIAEIQKGILDISRQEKPFDVFICYKETDANGRRTPDSVLANDLYHQLTNEGFKVFFSRITLEDKIGTAYEPYIFAALNSAKVMVVLGTKPEYFNAVWVKNEWSRYLALIRAGADKVLVPAYRDMDPYDLPEEFAHLQAQDMGKLGFMQDLIRGIKKITAGEQQEKTVPNSSGPGISSLHKRAILFLEDGNWDAAQEYLDRILDIDPEYAPAYIGKTQIALHVRQEENLAKQAVSFADNADFQKALRFASPQQKNVYSGYIKAIEDRIELERKEKKYQSTAGLEKGISATHISVQEQLYLRAAEAYEQLGEYKDAMTRAEHCRDCALSAKDEFRHLQEEEEKRKERERLEKLRQEEEKRKAEEKRRREEEYRRYQHKRKVRNVVMTVFSILLLLAGLAAAYKFLYVPHQQYAQAEVLLKNNRYQEALDAFTALGDYSDSPDKVREIWYRMGKNSLSAGKLSTAKTYLSNSHGYEDANTVIKQIDMYYTAEEADKNGDYVGAAEKYHSLGSFQDSNDRLDASLKKLSEYINQLYSSHEYQKYYDVLSRVSAFTNSKSLMEEMENKYNTGLSFMKEENYDQAIEVFSLLYDYSDSAENALECKYLKAGVLLKQKEYDQATAAFRMIPGYKDSNDKAAESQYEKAESLLSAGDMDGAIAAFEDVLTYKDSKDRALSVRYDKAAALWKDGKYMEAAKIFKALGNYKTANEDMKAVCLEAAEISLQNKDYVAALTAYQYLPQTNEIKEMEYKLAQNCYDMGNYAEAVAAYETLGQYELSASRLPVTRYAWADQLFKNGEYAKAAEQFTLLGDMTDSATRAKESVYQLAKSCLENKDYDIAKTHFASIPGYSDADTMCNECDYRKATDLLNTGKNKDAETIFKALGDYSDSKTKAEQCIYNQAEILFNNGKYEEAKQLYDTIAYGDSTTKAKQCVYNVADALFTAKDYSGAKTKFASIDYLDSKDRAKNSAYQEADVLYQDGKYADAETAFLSITGYNDSDDRAKDSHLQQGLVLMDSGEYQEALMFFESEDYANSTELAEKCYYELGRAAHLSGKTNDAIAKYAFAVSLTEAQDALISIAKDYIVINEPEKAIQTLWLVRNCNEAKELLVTTAETESTKGNIDNALIAYSSLEHHPEVDFPQLIQRSTFASVNSMLDNYDLLPSTLQFSKFVQYRFAILARDYHYYDLSVESFTKAGDYENASEQIKETRYLEASYVEENGDQEKAYSIFTDLGEYRDSFERANKPYYDLGLNKQKAEKWSEAVKAFEHAGSYSDAPTQILVTRFLEGMSKYDKEDWDGAYDAFTAAGQYENANEYAKDCLYQKANNLSSSGNYTAAFELYASIRGYKDVDSIIQSNKNIYSAGRDLYFSQTFKKNNIISFGRYGNTGVQWRVLDINKDEVLLISEYIIDYIPFNDENTDTPWEQCTLRKWLNGSFVKTAFSDSQQAAILTKTHSCNVEDGNPDVEGKRIGGKATKDKIFVFSYVECQTYFGILKDLPGATKYAASRNKYANNFWWLRNIYDHQKHRDQGHAEHFGSYISSKYFSSAFVSNDDVGVRPAIWITTKAKVFEEDAKAFISGK